MLHACGVVEGSAVPVGGKAVVVAVAVDWAVLVPVGCAGVLVDGIDVAVDVAATWVEVTVRVGVRVAVTVGVPWPEPVCRKIPPAPAAQP